MKKIRLSNILSLISEEIEKEAVKLSQYTWKSGGERLGYLSHFLEYHITSVIVCALRQNYTDYVIVEMPYYYLDINFREWGSERADFYAYDGQKGSGIQIIGEVKLGGPERSSMNTPSKFLRSILWDLKKLWSVDQTERYNRILVAVWEGYQKSTSIQNKYPKAPKDALHKIYEWLDSGWNDRKIPELIKFTGNRPDIGIVVSRMIELMKILHADYLSKQYSIGDRCFHILGARF